MRIGIDARMLGSHNGGLGRYVEQLVIHLLNQPSEHTFVLFLRQENWDAIAVNTDRVQRVLADIPWYSLSEQIHFPGIIKKAQVDLMHFPHWNVPIFYRGPFVLTIHDLIMYHYPRAEATTLGPITFFVKDMMHRLVLKSAARRAKKILVTSEFTKQDIFKTLGISKEKMVVTYQAPFRSSEPGVRSQEDGDGRYKTEETKKTTTYTLQPIPYVLYVGSAYPHKNLERLLQAWKLFQEKNENVYQLVLVGKDSPFYRRLMQHSTFHIQNVTHLGDVSDAELVELYRHASTYIFPSLYEGFGLPPLEAMQYGVPVVSSNRTCLPEVLGEAALYFDPENIDQMAVVIEQGLKNEDVRRTLRENAREELKRYSADRLVKTTLAVYNQSLS